LYFVILVEVKKSGDFTGLRLEEHIRLIKCLKGNNGMLFGTVVTFVVIENDA